jgi:hypothetical protein
MNEKEEETVTGGSIASRALKPVPAQLPATLDEWQRFIGSKRTINDLVEDAHRALLASDQKDKYRDFLFAVYDEQAVEGSLAADNLEAANMIREWANDKGNDELAREKKATIVKALGVVLRRYHASRKERRQMVDGQVVPNEGTE